MPALTRRRSIRCSSSSFATSLRVSVRSFGLVATVPIDVVAGERSRQATRREIQHFVALARGHPGACGKGARLVLGVNLEADRVLARGRRGASAVSGLGSGRCWRSKSGTSRTGMRPSRGTETPAAAWYSGDRELTTFERSPRSSRRCANAAESGGRGAGRGRARVAEEPPGTARRGADAPGSDRPPLSAQSLLHDPRVAELSDRREHAELIPVTRAR